jgi:hypothetical protein
MPKTTRCGVCGGEVHCPNKERHEARCRKQSEESRDNWRRFRRWVAPHSSAMSLAIERRDRLADFIDSRRYGSTKADILEAFGDYEGATFKPTNTIGMRLLRDLRALKAAGRIARVLIPSGALYTRPGREHLIAERDAA